MGPTLDNVTKHWCRESDHFAPTTMRIASEWIEQHYKDKFFLYVDTWDPHKPWQPPQHYVDLYDDQSILDLVDILIPDRVQAESLVDLLAGKADTVRDFVVTLWPIYVAGQIIRVVDDEERNMRENQPTTTRDKTWAILYSIAGEPVELDNLNDDPKQEHNVFADHIEIAERLH